MSHFLIYSDVIKKYITDEQGPDIIDGVGLIDIKFWLGSPIHLKIKSTITPECFRRLFFYLKRDDHKISEVCMVEVNNRDLKKVIKLIDVPETNLRAITYINMGEKEISDKLFILFWWVIKTFYFVFASLLIQQLRMATYTCIDQWCCTSSLIPRNSATSIGV